MAAPPANEFYQRTRDAKKVMVLDLGFLGDAIHLLPALWMVRQAYPQAELHVTLATHATALLELVPWVDQRLGLHAFPAPRHVARKHSDGRPRLRREKFDVVINLNGSDRSSWLTYLSGAPERLGRMPGETVPPLWRRMFTAHVHYPFKVEPLGLQRCRCLEKAGFPFIPPEFHAEVDPAHLRSAGLSEADAGSYFHIGPFTTADRKELPPPQLVEFINALQKSFPEKKLVLSCAPTERERGKMTELLAALPQKPWRIFPGDLSIPQLAAVIRHSALHFSGDTGTMHLAAMTNTPLIAWFWPNPARAQWIPVGEKFRVIVGANGPESPYLGKIDTSELIRTAQSVLAGHPTTIYPATQKSES